MPRFLWTFTQLAYLLVISQLNLRWSNPQSPSFRSFPPFKLIDSNSIYFLLVTSTLFKNASAFLLRDARHATHDILLLRISAILPEAISDGGLTPTTDTALLLATYRDGSHLTSDITFDFIRVLLI